MQSKSNDSFVKYNLHMLTSLLAVVSIADTSPSSFPSFSVSPLGPAGWATSDRSAISTSATTACELAPTVTEVSVAGVSLTGAPEAEVSMGWSLCACETGVSVVVVPWSSVPEGVGCEGS